VATELRVSAADRAFVEAFEACAIAPPAFHHREHVRLAYIYLCLADGGVGEAHARLRASLRAFIRHNGVDPAKYHETLTQAWMLAVDHFMTRSAPAASSDDFIDANPRLLDTGIMLTHYSKDTLFSDEARHKFVEPDLQNFE